MRHHAHHTGHAAEQPSKHVDYLQLHIGAQTGALPVLPVRVSLDQHHSVKKQGRRHLSAGRHARIREGKYPPEQTAVRKWIADRHRHHILMERGDHVPL